MKIKYAYNLHEDGEGTWSMSGTPQGTFTLSIRHAGTAGACTTFEMTREEAKHTISFLKRALKARY